jgi:peptidoglycan/LPS O-acetylase OafA/YrhL
VSPTSHRGFPTLNAVRAAGALMVLVTHVAFNTGQVTHGWTGAVMSRLDFGVTLFFILSGFLLSRPFYIARATGAPLPSVRHYYWKRALRILPLYWVVVVVALLVDPANDDASAWEWFTDLTLTQVYRAGPPSSSLTQMWSLCVEVAFYLVLPVLVSGFGRRELRLSRVAVWLGTLSVFGVAWQAWAATVSDGSHHQAQWLFGFLPWFCVGMFLAAASAGPQTERLHRRLEALGTDLTGCWILAAAVFALACTPLAGPRTLIPPTALESALKCVLYGVAGACFVLPLVFGPALEGRIRTFLSSPVPFGLGEISYGIFAIHMFVLVNGMRVLGIEVFTGQFVLVLVLVLVTTLLLATVSFYGFERRVLRLKDRGPWSPGTTSTKDTESAHKT